YNNNRQNDCQELLHFILDTIHEETKQKMNGIKLNNISYDIKNFQFVLQEHNNYLNRYGGDDQKIETAMKIFNEYKNNNINTNLNTKISTLIDFPINKLNLNKYLYDEQKDESDNEYDLSCVAYHVGSSVNNEHYYAKCKNMLDGNWYLYEDSNIKKIGVDEI